MRKKIIFILLCCGIQLLHAKYTPIESLKFSNNFNYKQKAVWYEGFVLDSLTKHVGGCEFEINDTLYIISDAFDQDYNEFKHLVPNVPKLVQELMLIYPTEGDCDNCGYNIVIDSHTPATLTIYTDLDTIQYTTTPLPDLYMASISDTIFCSSNIKCGVLINELLSKLLGCVPYHDYMSYNNIALIPQTFDYMSYQKNGYLILPDACFLLKIKNNAIERIEFRQFNYSGKMLIDALLFY